LHYLISSVSGVGRRKFLLPFNFHEWELKTDLLLVDKFVSKAYANLTAPLSFSLFISHHHSPSTTLLGNYSDGTSNVILFSPLASELSFQDENPRGLFIFSN
jgi:hypothetical protein